MKMFHWGSSPCSILCILKGETMRSGHSEGAAHVRKQPCCLLSPQLNLPFPTAGFGDARGARVDVRKTPVPPADESTGGIFAEATSVHKWIPEVLWDHGKFGLVSTVPKCSLKILEVNEGMGKERICQMINCQEYFSGVGFPLDPMPAIPWKLWLQAEQRNFKGLKWWNVERALDKRESVVLNKIYLAFWSIGAMPF